jgi:hypothetical protein
MNIIIIFRFTYCSLTKFVIFISYLFSGKQTFIPKVNPRLYNKISVTLDILLRKFKVYCSEYLLIKCNMVELCFGSIAILVKGLLSV